MSRTVTSGRTTATGRTTASNRVYIPRVQNLQQHSEVFQNVDWTKTLTTALDNQLANPVNGATTAALITDSNDGGASTHIVAANGFLAIKIGELYCWSVFAKAGTVGYIQMIGQGGATAYFNLSNGTIGTTAGTVTPLISALANGWYRCSIAYTATSAFNPLKIDLSKNGSTVSYQGNGTGTIYLFGGQAIIGNWPGPYIQTVGSVVNTGNIRSQA